VFWRTLCIGLAQSFCVQEIFKVLLITLVSPAFFSRICRPNTKRAGMVRLCMRSIFNALLPML
jgi:hypothetical protein